MRPRPGPGPTSEPWKRALASVVTATAQEGQPWSCPGGELSVDVDADGRGARIRLRDAKGREVTRHVPEPNELVPTVEALVASRSLPAREPLPEAPPEAPPPPPPASAPEVPSPRVVFEPLVGLRVGTPALTMWGSAGARVTIPLGAWSTGFGARYGAPLWMSSTGQAKFSYSELSFNVSGGRRLLAGPIELHATLDPSINLVSKRKLGLPSQAAASAETAIDPRLGLGLRASFRWTDTWRGAAAIEGEVGPSGGGAGASLGVEAVLR